MKTSAIHKIIAFRNFSDINFESYLFKNYIKLILIVCLFVYLFKVTLLFYNFTLLFIIFNNNIRCTVENISIVKKFLNSVIIRRNSQQPTAKHLFKFMNSFKILFRN